MKLLRFDDDGRARLGAAMDGGKVVPLDQIADRYPTMLSLVEGGDDGLAAVREAVRSSGGHLDLAALKLLAPIERPGKFLAIGMNYKKHLAEAQKLGIAVPTHQYWFNKQTSCIAGPNDGIEPGASDQLDYEVELAVIIGRTAKNVSAAEAPAYVFGYAVTDDVTARDWQRHSPTFTVGKSFDTHGPIGPVDRYGRRDRRPASTWPALLCQRRAAAGRQHQRTDLRRLGPDRVSFARLHARSGRHSRDWDPRRSGRRAQSAGVPAGRRCGPVRGRRDRRN